MFFDSKKGFSAKVIDLNFPKEFEACPQEAFENMNNKNRPVNQRNSNKSNSGSQKNASNKAKRPNYVKKNPKK